MCPISSIAMGGKVRIVKVPSLRCRYLERLVDMGLAPGSTIEICSTEGSFMTLRVGLHEMQIGPGLCRKIMVEELDR